MTFRSVLFPAPFGPTTATIDPERHVVDGREAAEALGDRVDLEEQAGPPTTVDGTASAAAT